MSTKKAIMMLLAVLGVVFYLYETNSTDSSRTGKELVFGSLEKDEIVAIGLQHAGGQVSIAQIESGYTSPFAAVLSEKKEEKNTWALLEPKGVILDDDALQDLIKAILSLEIIQSIDTTKDDSEFGLDKPRLKVAVETTSEEYVIEFGKRSPVATKRFARRGGGSEIFLVEEDSFSALKKNREDLWVKNPLQFDEETISQLALTVLEDPQFVLEREAVSAPWSVLVDNALSPVEEDRVKKFFSKLKSLSVDRYVNVQSPNLGYYKITNPLLSITFKTFSMSEIESPFVVSFGEVVESKFLMERAKSNPENKERVFYFKLKDNPLIIEFTGSVYPYLFSSKNELRDPSLLALLNLKQAQTLELSLGMAPVRLENADGAWSLASNKDKEKEISAWVAEFGTYSALQFVEFSPDEPVPQLETQKYYIKCSNAQGDTHVLSFRQEVTSLTEDASSGDAPLIADLEQPSGERLRFVVSGAIRNHFKLLFEMIP